MRDARSLMVWSMDGALCLRAVLGDTEPAVGGREVDGEGNSSMVGALCLRAFLGDAEPAVAGREVVGGEGVAVRARSPRRSGREGVGGEGVAEA